MGRAYYYFVSVLGLGGGDGLYAFEVQHDELIQSHCWVMHVPSGSVELISPH
jgi:hypothetical protein